MITIQLNGAAQQISQSQNLDGLLGELNDLPDNFAIAVNENFVPQGAYSSTPINDGDRIELLVPMQGG